jgi:hypothetical protein
MKNLSILKTAKEKTPVSRGAVEKAVLVKLDVNHDFPETYAPNQLTFGDILGMCLAIYGKGSATRLEGRNMNPNLPIPEFLEKLQILFRAEKPVAGEDKATENNAKQKATTFAKIALSKQVSEEAKETESNQKQQDKQPIATSNYVGERC